MAGVTQAVGEALAPSTAVGGRALTLPRLWAFTSVALPVVASLEASMSSVDLAYQIRAGNLMLFTHHLLRHDTFTFTAAGRAWTDQQWGAQIAFALIWRAGGWAALALLRAALVGAIYAFVYLACRRAGASQRAGALLTLGSFGVSVGGLALRPQLLGMALFALSVYLVGRRRSGRWVWAMPAVVALWANVHGSFFLGPVLLGLALAADAASRSPAWRRTGGVLLASTAATLLNPFGPRVWSYAWGISTNPVITRFITEWQPPSIRDVAGASFFVSGAAVALLFARRTRPVPWPTALALGVFFFIGLQAVRGIFWWALVAPPLVAPLLGEVLPHRATEQPQPLPGHDRGNPALNLALASALVVLGVAFLPWWRGGTRARPSEDLVTNAPESATDALLRLLKPGDRVFDPVPLGSWLELALPQNPVFLDPRIEVFPAEVVREHLRISLGGQGWQSLLTRWHVTVVVADREEQAGLLTRISRDPGWKLEFSDGQRSVFARTARSA